MTRRQDEHMGLGIAGAFWLLFALAIGVGIYEEAHKSDADKQQDLARKSAQAVIGPPAKPEA
jgi:hypothetical protein